MNHRFIAFITLLVLTVASLQAGPVSLSNFPAHLQLYARDANNTATVPITGAVTSAGYDSVILSVYRSGEFWKQQAQGLSYSGGRAAFDLSTTIDAGMIEYTFRLSLRNGGAISLAASADSIACGDVYIIGGQSNAHPTSEEATYQNEFCRTLGLQTGHENEDAYNAADTLWGLSRGTAGPLGARSGPFLVGTWGILLQKMLLETYQIPTAVFNGAAGGSPIEENLRKANPMDLATVYGRLLYRVSKARLVDKVRAFMWYQGESNTYSYKDPSYDTTYYYYAFLKELYWSWVQDYPGIQKFYMFQIRPGCGGDSRLRNLQRTLADSLPRTEVISTEAVPGHDGCHFDYNGYSVIANNMFLTLARDFYFSSDTVGLRAPNVLRAFYTTSQHNEIALVFKDRGPGLIWPADTMISGSMRSLKNYISLDSTFGLVQSTRVSGDTIKLQLTRASSARTIGYLPERYYPGTTVIFEGPWIVNARGVGAFTFWGVPIGGSALGVQQTGTEIPTGFRLDQNYPNPFNPTTTVHFTVRAPSMVRLQVFDLLGREVESIVDNTLQAGEYSATIDAANYASGPYFYRLTAVPVAQPEGRYTETKMMTVLR